MDKLSQLISEAKPLYKERKRRNNIFKLLLIITVPVITITSVAGLYMQGEEIYMSFENNNFQNELLTDDLGFLR